MAEIPKTTTMLYTPEDVVSLVLADAHSRGLNCEVARIAVRMEERGGQRDHYQCEVFAGIEVEIQLNLGGKSAKR